MVNIDTLLKIKEQNMTNKVSYMEECKARREIVLWGKELYDRGLVNGSGGNLSIRLADDTVLFTPTGWFLGHLTEDMITKTDLEGNVLDGIKPTKEVPLHLAVYHTRVNVNAVVHSHSTYATAFASMSVPGTKMPIYVPSVAAKVGNVIVTGFELPGTVALGDNVRREIANSNAVLLANHGVVAVGENMQSAVSVASEVEGNAQLFFVTNGKARTLAQADVATLFKKLPF